MRKKTELPLIAVVFFAVLAVWSVSKTNAASFDCTKATTKIEKMICANSLISGLDEDLAKAYTEAMANSSNPSYLKEGQRKWLSGRNRCLDEGCLQEKYQQRLSELRQNVPSYEIIYPADVSEFDVDCNKTESVAEKLICKQIGSPEEQEWMMEHHKKILLPDLQWTLMRSQDKEQQLELQREWQKEVLDSCPDARCCLNAYRERRMELRAMWERPGNCYTLKPSSQGKGDYETVRVDNNGKVPPIEPVCQAMEANLNLFCDQPPMACELMVAPGFQQQITFPAWVPLDPEANLALIEEFVRAPWENGVVKGASQRRWDEERPQIEAALVAKRLTFSKAQLDLYNLGRMQPAYRLDFGTCEIDNPQLTDGPTRWWEEPLRPARVKTQQAPGVIRPLIQEYVSFDNGTASETFLYGGQTYTYGMMGDEGKKQLYVNRHERRTNLVNHKLYLTKSNICTFDYKPINEERNEL